MGTFTPGASVGYAVASFSFVASGSASVLRFTDTSGGNSISDLYLDGVSVSAVPEAADVGLWAGVVMCGAVVWRRRRG
jgi:MYXO-CTERM domain-containing protein